MLVPNSINNLNSPAKDKVGGVTVAIGGVRVGRTGETHIGQGKDKVSLSFAGTI